MNDERWIPTYEYPMYEVSNTGYIRNAHTKKILKTQINKQGYKTLSLSKDGKVRTVRVNRLIAQSFYGGSFGGLDVDHVDTNKQNNHISNLQFCTRKENVRCVVEHGIMSKNDYRNHRVKIRDLTTGTVYNSMNECERATGIDHSEISKYLSGKIKYPCKGRTFERVI